MTEEPTGKLGADKPPNTESHFIPGLELSEIFYKEAIQPILQSDFPQLEYATGLIGPGSEVLGFDTPQSMDHHWGPKAQIFVSAQDNDKYSAAITETLSNKLPYDIRGIPTNFGKPDNIGVQLLEKIDKGPVNHLVTLHTVNGYFEDRIGRNPKDLTMKDWLVVPEQRLLEVTAGKVFHDGLGELTAAREMLSYYPNDVWLYLLSSQWAKIAQEEAFVGRCGDVGDELGSQIVASRIAREIMRLGFYLEKKYVPYTKWLGTAFSKLEISQNLSPVLREVLLSTSWKQREESLGRAYEIVATKHNSLGISDPLPTKVSNFYDRPYLVIHADKFAIVTRDAIKDEAIKGIKTKIGSVNQFVDSTDVLSNIPLTKKMNTLYEP